MQELVERSMDRFGVAPEPGPPSGSSPPPAKRARRRSVTVNLAESPLSWLRARRMVDARQHEAGERLRADYERAAIAPRVTMRWDAAPASSTRRSADAGIDRTLAQLSAKQRFDAAVAAAGPGLSDILWRVICAGEGLPVAEKGLGWPARSGKLVLCLALDRIAAHYRLP